MALLEQNPIGRTDCSDISSLYFNILKVLLNQKCYLNIDNYQSVSEMVPFKQNFDLYFYKHQYVFKPCALGAKVLSTWR